VDAFPGRTRLVAGLGNPGIDYARTRHNAGFLVLDRLAARREAAFRTSNAWRGEFFVSAGALYVKPLTYMNLSGESVSAVARFYRIRPAEVLVVLDDFALPLGRLRLRPGGSSGGHNGLQSVIDHLGTQDVPRLRIGIGPPDGEETSRDHVLRKFRSEERQIVENSLDRAADAVEYT
jgi:PTH1 family peptidyl-tRNA hydrolase